MCYFVIEAHNCALDLMLFLTHWTLVKVCLQYACICLHELQHNFKSWPVTTVALRIFPAKQKQFLKIPFSALQHFFYCCSCVSVSYHCITVIVLLQCSSLYLYEGIIDQLSLENFIRYRPKAASAALPPVQTSRPAHNLAVHRVALLHHIVLQCIHWMHCSAIFSGSANQALSS